MQNKNIFSRLSGKLPQFHFKLTRTRLFLFALTLIVFGFALGGLESGSDDEAVASKIVNLDLPARDDFFVPPTDSIGEISGDESTTGLISPLEEWESVTVRSGQSLDNIFRQQGFSAKTLHEIMALNAETKQLKKIRPGDLFEFQRHEDNSLRRMRYAVDEANYLIIEHDGQQAFASTESRYSPSRRFKHVSK